MIIILKNKHSLKIDNFKFKCCVGKKGIDKEKTEGDKKTPKGIFGLEKLYYRNDRIKKPFTKLKCIKITKNMGWCNNVKDKINYNQLMVIPIKYNWKKRIPGKGSCIFLHLTKNYKSTEGCIALSKKDFLIMLKLINTKTKIKIC